MRCPTRCGAPYWFGCDLGWWLTADRVDSAAFVMPNLSTNVCECACRGRTDRITILGCEEFVCTQHVTFNA